MMPIAAVGDTVEALYQQYCETPGDMQPHLPRLRALAEGCDLVVEFGVRHGASTTALLLAARHVVSYDIRCLDGAKHLQHLARDRWTFHVEDSRIADVPRCDLLFWDSMNTYEHLRVDLTAHADKVRHRLVIHNTVGWGCVGDGGGLGIRPAIDELMMRDDSWRITAHYLDVGGLLVLERRERA